MRKICGIARIRLLFLLGLLAAAALATALPPAFADEPLVTSNGALEYTQDGDTVEIEEYRPGASPGAVQAAIDELASKGAVSIGPFAFSKADMDSLSLYGVKEIQREAFASSGVKEVLTDASLESIEAEAFSVSKLERIVLGESVANIGDKAFYNCAGLAEILVVDDEDAVFSDLGGALVQKAEGRLIQYPTGSDETEYTVPEGVAEIGSYAFAHAVNLERVVSDHPVSILEYAFSNCGRLAEADFSGSIGAGDPWLGVHAFDGCTALESVSLSVKDAQGDAFYGCTALRDLRFYDGLAALGDFAFEGCESLKSVSLPASLTELGLYPFSGCYSLEEIIVTGTAGTPGSYLNLGDDGVLFRDDGAASTLVRYPAGKQDESYFVPEGVSAIGDGAFDGAGALKGIALRDVKAIGESAFSRCEGIEAMELPDGLEEIGDGAFSETSIRELHVPVSVARIGTGNGGAAFVGMESLEALSFAHGMTSLPERVFYEIGLADGSHIDIYVPMSVIEVVPYPAGGEIVYMPRLGDVTVYGVEGSYILAWAAENLGGQMIGTIAADITGYVAQAYRLVPYQYIITTLIPDNRNLRFVVVDASKLPPGMGLMADGQFYGAPSKLSGANAFTFEVKVYFTLFGEGDHILGEYLMDWQEIRIAVSEPDDGDLAELSEAYYSIDEFVGAPGAGGGYVLVASPGGIVGDQDFLIRDSDEDIALGLSNFRYFKDFWLDGIPLVSGPALAPGQEPGDEDYHASDGSTRVTVYAKTFLRLDAGVHTIAAEFMIPNESGDGKPDTQRVVAQKFRLDIAGGGKDNGGNNNGGGRGSGGNGAGGAGAADADAGAGGAGAAGADPGAGGAGVAGADLGAGGAGVAGADAGAGGAGVAGADPGAGGAAAGAGILLDGLPVGEGGLYYFEIDG
ncbi:MAG: leucine-rich repeat domain-containing protein, partial [Clostridiales Family XIII bacterium]|nr:leucine-rich repeat domain-containing protein [Clostridiales Family XIII bacterium]